MIAEAKGWDDIETFADSHFEWLKQFLVLPGGAPSDDTFQRVFVRLDAKAFSACFSAWMKSLMDTTEGKLIAIDGKTLRRSFDTATGRTPLHLVHA